jgi:hypothetical protein
MGLCFLLTLYGFVRGNESPTPTRWYALSMVACLAGMATKEVMVSAPLLVLLYDRTLLPGHFGRPGGVVNGSTPAWRAPGCCWRG